VTQENQIKSYLPFILPCPCLKLSRLVLQAWNFFFGGGGGGGWARERKKHEGCASGWVKVNLFSMKETISKKSLPNIGSGYTETHKST